MNQDQPDAAEPQQEQRSGFHVRLATVLSIVLLAVIVGTVVVAVILLGYSANAIREARRAAIVALFGGLVAASFVEIVRRATSLRGAFQRAMMRRSFGPATPPQADSRATVVDSAGGSGSGVRNARSPIETKLPVDKALYYSAPTNTFAAQLSELADRVLASPKPDMAALCALVGPDQTSLAEDYKSSREAWENVKAQNTGEREAAGRVLSERTARIGAVIESRIDAFQVTTTAQWRLVLRLEATAVSAAAAGLIAAGVQLEDAGVVAAVAAGLTIGTVVAWVTNDILAGIERLRG